MLLQIALKDLKAIVVADLTLNGVTSSLRELAEITTDLFIVRTIFYILLAFYSILPFLLACYQSRIVRSVS